MSHKLPIFNHTWIQQASSSNVSDDSWAKSVIDNLNGSGNIYLENIRDLFNRFPAKPRKKRQLRGLLEDFDTPNHLGGVNELCWWNFLERSGFEVELVTEKNNEKRPDFYIKKPEEFYCEVTTMNVSNRDKELLSNKNGVRLEQEENVERFLRKLEDEAKSDQIKFGATQNKNSILVVFDYSEWSGYGVLLNARLKEFLYDQQKFNGWLPGLSALIYIYRRVENGRIIIEKKKSAIYNNPNLISKLSLDSLDIPVSSS